MSVPYPLKIALASRSGNRCAMPSCHRVLSEPCGDEHVTVGEVAHIAGRGGAKRGRSSSRFDPYMTDEATTVLLTMDRAGSQTATHRH
jgi:hypothetical protein